MERERESTASGFPMIVATVEVASDKMEEVSTPSRLTLVERLRHGIVSVSLSPIHSDRQTDRATPTHTTG
ncbi:hypothetical protein TSUD_262250 [Trifolium subterraneum]|nr:hypothetical protein TSUD_262250 [Trifolium subterraneum]